MSTKSQYQFITGSEAVVLGALEGGAEAMYGYPITPSTEILQGWIKRAEENKALKFLQTEDETTAGFALIGALLAGKKAFTATAGPGTVLMQDPLSMAENLRLPFVSIIMQRGGPSTGTVNFSQQEVNLCAFGGNGDGLRIVYSAANGDELYRLTAKAFSTAWKFRFPTLVLGDGHLAKMYSKTKISSLLKPYPASPILKGSNKPTYLKNCFSSEESFYKERLRKNLAAWQEYSNKIAESECYETAGAKEIIIAHGSVAEVCREAIDILRKYRRKIGLFRPITLNPIDTFHLRKAVEGKKRIFIIESALNQLSRIIKYEIYGQKVPIIEISRPALSFSANEIIRLIEEARK